MYEMTTGHDQRQGERGRSLDVVCVSKLAGTSCALRQITRITYSESDQQIDVTVSYNYRVELMN